jgi:hypothetical protein
VALLDDRLSKPAAGREFPDSFRSIVQQVQSLAFSVHDDRERLPILMENCVAECDRGHQLCSFMRMGYLAVFSLPEDTPRGIAAKALEIALQRYGEIDRGPHLSTRDQQFVVYRAFLAPLGWLSITRHVVQGVSRSYLQFRKASQLPKTANSTRGQHELHREQIV